MVDLVQSYGDLCGALERAATRPRDLSLPTLPGDFPQETAERLEVLRSANRYEKALAVKDQVFNSFRLR